jgi:hypothetical protein
MERGGARWQIADILIAQQQPTTLKKEDQRTPKGIHRVPYPGRSKALSESANRETTNCRKNGKNDLQLNTPNPLPLKLPHSSKHHYLVIRPTSGHTQELRAPHFLIQNLLPSP